LQHDQEQLNLKAKISEVEAEERVYWIFEKKDGWSDRISAARSSAKKSPLNPNVVEWPACTIGNVKKEVSSAQDQGASVEVKNEIYSARDEGANVGVKERDLSVQGKQQHVSANSTLFDEPRLLLMIRLSL